MFSQDGFSNFMKQWVDHQTQAYNAYQNNFFKPFEGSTSTEKEQSTDSLCFSKFHNQWLKMSNDFINKNINFLDKNSYGELFQKLASSSNLYCKLNHFWVDLNQVLTKNDPEALMEFSSQWQKKYMNFLTEHFFSYLPESTQSLLKEPMEICQAYFHSMENFFQPWIHNTKDFQELFLKIYSGDKDAFLSYTKLFREDYEKSFGKLFKAPVAGINREYLEKQIASLDSFIDYTYTLNEFFATIYKVGSQTIEKIITNYQDMAKEGSQPKTFKEFYEYWWQQNEKAYVSLFNTNDFSKLLGHLTDTTVVFKKNFDNLMEQQLQVLPLPTKTDMHSLYKTIYDLKKEVKSLKKEIYGLQDLIEKKNNEEKNA